MDTDRKLLSIIEEKRDNIQNELEVELEQPSTEQNIAVKTSSIPTRSELVKIYLLSMRLPSKYLVQKVEYVKNSQAKHEIRKWEGEIAKKASQLDSIRREVYNEISRIFCHVIEYGTWIAITEQAVEEAKRISNYVIEKLRKMGFDDSIIERYTVKAIPVYLEPEEARELLYYAIRKLSEDVDELKQKIDEAEKEKNLPALRRLEKEKAYREALLVTFKNYLAQLG